MHTPKKEQIIAGAATLGVAMLLLLLLFYCGLRIDRSELAQDSIPEEPAETLYIDPEFLTEPGENMQQPEQLPSQEAPSPAGLPEKSETEIKEKVVSDNNPEVNKSTEKIVTQKQTSPVATTKPSEKTKEESQISSKMGSAFSVKNGSPEGNANSAGSGGKGEGVSGKLNGRTFMGCTLPKVRLTTTYTVKISVSVNEEGRVISASVSSSGGAGQEILSKCVAAAKTAKWSEKPGAAEARGILTFTLVPKL